jgi:hypothetical protein
MTLVGSDHDLDWEFAFDSRLGLARNPMERRFLGQRVSACERGDTPQAYYERFWHRQLVSLKTRVKATRKSKQRS